MKIVAIKFLSLMAFGFLLGLSPASAGTYSVDFDVPSSENTPGENVTVMGSITTSCDSCDLTSADITSWLFNITGTFSGIVSGTNANVSGSNDPGPGSLIASGGFITLNLAAPGDTSFSESGAVVADIRFNGVGVYISIYSVPGYADNLLPFPYTVATEEVSSSSATPLPAALPLFGTVLGVGGLFGWRRKRKSQSVAAWAKKALAGEYGRAAESGLSFDGRQYSGMSAFGS
jgi:hypothetical protein